MPIDIHIQQLSDDVYELQVDRFIYHLNKSQVLDLYNSIKKLLENNTDEVPQ